MTEAKSKGQALCDFMNEHSEHQREWLRANGYDCIAISDASNELLNMVFIASWKENSEGIEWGWIILNEEAWFPKEHIQKAVDVMHRAGWEYHVCKRCSFWQPPKDVAAAAHRERIQFHEARIANIMAEH